MKEKESKQYAEASLKEEIGIINTRIVDMATDLKLELDKAERIKLVAASTMDMLKKKLEDKKRYVDMMKNPRSYEEPKSFLASEKLAERKQNSPDKIRAASAKIGKRKKVRRSSSKVDRNLI
jgi:hypothetical protein